VLGVAVVGQHDLDAGVQEGEFAQPVLQRGVIELDHRERLGRGREIHLRAAPSARVADHRERGHRVAVAELHESAAGRRARCGA
jgi:hypothetical protein